ncbi:MAG: nucleotide exchange factor GrpE [Deltaproteobacteria bacterium]|nr:nucleotide exchange factor GrpE [Deltaproteobacteria bacterium]
MAESDLQNDGSATSQDNGGDGGSPAAAGAAPPGEEPPVPIEEEDAAAAAAAPPGPSPEQRIAALEAEVAGLQTQLAQAKDRWLRMAADFDNARKRAAKQEIEVRERARVETLRAALPVIDNVERALGYARELPAATTIAEGLKLVVKSFFDAFAAHKLERFESAGQAFDPARHEAVGQVETTDVPAGTVVQELEAGYRLGEKLLRPALVTVARAPRPAAAPPAAEETAGAGPAAGNGEPPDGGRGPEGDGG